MNRRYLKSHSRSSYIYNCFFHMTRVIKFKCAGLFIKWKAFDTLCSITFMFRFNHVLHHRRITICLQIHSTSPLAVRKFDLKKSKHQHCCLRSISHLQKPTHAITSQHFMKCSNSSCWIHFLKSWTSAMLVSLSKTQMQKNHDDWRLGT